MSCLLPAFSHLVHYSKNLTGKQDSLIGALHMEDELR